MNAHCAGPSSTHFSLLKCTATSCKKLFAGITPSPGKELVGKVNSGAGGFSIPAREYWQPSFPVCSHPSPHGCFCLHPHAPTCDGCYLLLSWRSCEIILLWIILCPEEYVVTVYSEGSFGQLCVLKSVLTHLDSRVVVCFFDVCIASIHLTFV